MPVRLAHGEWKGNLKEGAGTVKLGSGAFEGAYSFPSRFEEGDGTNPEELLGAAHAACYSMALANMLASEGHEVESISTDAKVHLGKGDDGFEVTKIVLETTGKVAGMSAEEFQAFAEKAKVGCPISRALKATEIHLNASLA